jgi:hypothetical protein
MKHKIVAMAVILTILSLVGVAAASSIHDSPECARLARTPGTCEYCQCQKTGDAIQPNPTINDCDYLAKVPGTAEYIACH